MRASSLSNRKVIELLNKHFVPVVARNGDYAADGDASADEKAAYQRVFRDFYRFSDEHKQAGKRPISVGTVHAYVLTPEGRPLDALHVAEAARPERLIEMLERSIQTLGTQAGAALVKPFPRATAPDCQPDALVLHLTARYLNRDGDKEVPYIPTLGTERSGQWGALPSEDWVVLDRPAWTKLLPADSVAVGDSWPVDREVTATLLRHFYPPSEENDVNKNRIQEQTLTAKVLSEQNGVVRVRLDGRLKMQHAFYPGRKDDNFVTAPLIGFMDITAANAKANTDDSALTSRRILRLQLATVSARYGSGPDGLLFGVAVRSVSPGN